jgi:hypothetical protein
MNQSNCDKQLQLCCQHERRHASLHLHQLTTSLSKPRNLCPVPPEPVVSVYHIACLPALLWQISEDVLTSNPNQEAQDTCVIHAESHTISLTQCLKLLLRTTEHLLLSRLKTLRTLTSLDLRQKQVSALKGTTNVIMFAISFIDVAITALLSQRTPSSPNTRPCSPCQCLGCIMSLVPITRAPAQTSISSDFHDTVVCRLQEQCMCRAALSTAQHTQPLYSTCCASLSLRWGVRAHQLPKHPFKHLDSLAIGGGGRGEVCLPPDRSCLFRGVDVSELHHCPPLPTRCGIVAELCLPEGTHLIHHISGWHLCR